MDTQWPAVASKKKKKVFCPSWKGPYCIVEAVGRAYELAYFYNAHGWAVDTLLNA